MKSKLLSRLALPILLLAPAMARAQTVGCVNAGTAWQNASFSPLTVPFTATFDATPSTAKMDGLVGLSNGPASSFSSLAAIVRFNNLGRIDARNGSAYAAATSVSYTAGAKYHFRLAVDPANHVYSAYVTPPGGAEKTLGTRYAFRTEQAKVSSLSDVGSVADTGSEQVCAFTAAADGAPAPSPAPAPTPVALTASTAWQALAFAAQSAPFTAAFDMTPKAAGVDVVAGLSKGTPTAYGSLAALVRFNQQGTIDARNGSAYAADRSVPYAANVAYHFRLAVDPVAHRYSVYVTPQGGSELALASSYAFRTEQAATSSLDHLGLIAGTAGAATLSSFAVSAGAVVPPPPDTTAPTVALTAPASGARVSGTVTVSANASDNVGVAGVQFLLDGSPLGAEATTAPYTASWNTTSVADGGHTLTAVARDAAGNKTTSAALSVTVANAAPAASAYNQAVLKDNPVMFLAMDTPSAGTQSDLSGHGNDGTYQGGAPGAATLPNGEKAASFNGVNQYLTVRSVPALSVPTSGVIVVESWIKPATLQFANSEAEGYVYFLGKGNPSDGYEYANRMYSKSNTANRPNRISDYAWNRSGGLGSGAYFQDAVDTSNWIMVTDVINMRDKSSSYPTGYISIYKNGVLRGKVRLDQYNVVPSATNSPFNVGTRNYNSWFQGAIGKVAVYDHLLTDAQIAAHYAAMSQTASLP